MMVYFRKRLPKAVINYCNERIVRYGLSVIGSATVEDHDDDHQVGFASGGTPGSVRSLSQLPWLRRHAYGVVRGNRSSPLASQPATTPAAASDLIIFSRHCWTAGCAAASAFPSGG
jgi:hypothetical protein